MKTYETTQGDTWDIIAAKHYGSEMAIAPLLEVNSSYQDMVVFPSGICLQVPELPAGYKNSDTLPPWRNDE